MKLIDLTGKRFGHLLVLHRADTNTKWPYWTCKCDCGNIKDVSGSCLRRGITKSCGCSLGRIKHGLSYTSLYNVYDGMKARCYNPEHNRYHCYGGRGIKICDEWLGEHGRDNFLTWAINNGYQKGLSIDRIDVNGNYEPDNCRWTTNSVQMFNRQKRKSILGQRGVYYIPEKHKYRAEIICEGQKHHLGYFENIEDAIRVRKEAELKYFNQVLD